MNTARVRYMVKELDPAVAFYTKCLGFRLERQVRPNFAIVSRGPLELVLSTPYGPGGAAKPMLDGGRSQAAGTGSSSASRTSARRQPVSASCACTSAATSSPGRAGPR